MTKETYIIELRKRLSLLQEEEVDNIIQEYLEYIRQKVTSGISEGLAIEQMGNVNNVAKEILKSYKISDRYIKLFIGKEKVIDDLGEFANKVQETSTTIFHRIEDKLSDISKNTSSVAKNALKETVKYGGNRINDVKTIFKKSENTQDTKSQDENDHTNK
ncbi:MAG: hypothetical protein K0Q49_1078 [Haloplasmataceae bacterium]|jgi:hypothetical protein|nr:hypothetical protein [Haloplasmataceae bacterium]